MTLTLTMHCDGTIDGRRCLSFANVRTDAGAPPMLDVETFLQVLTTGKWPYHPDAGDGVHCEDPERPSESDPFRRRTAWVIGTSAGGASTTLCPLHDRFNPTELV